MVVVDVESDGFTRVFNLEDDETQDFTIVVCFRFERQIIIL